MPAQAEAFKAITASRVRKVYDTPSGAVEAVAGADFEIARGDFVAILGPSGCGKSTLMLMIAGLEPATSGTITLDGLPVSGPQIDTGMMFQDPTLLPWRSVLDNVLFPIDMRGAVLPENRTRAESLLRMVDLWAFRDKRPRELSGGMRQRVALARALINDPRILLMDEPFSALDAITRDEMGLALARIWDATRKTAIFITHSIREAIFLSDRILVMGRRPSTIIEDVEVPFERPRDPSIEADPRFNELYLHLKASIHRSPSAAQ
jgi:NitT/TauT family transport system ATP-binding protein